MAIKNARRLHLMKTATWRIIASLTTFFLGWAITGNLNIGLTLGISDVVIKSFLYYAHERAWFRYSRAHFSSE